MTAQPGPPTAHPDPQAAVREPVLAVTSPLAYAAFCQLYHGAYLHYAHLRTGNVLLAEQAVAAAFVQLQDRWPTVLSSACPAAHAWAILTQTLSAYGTSRGPEGSLPPGRTADALRLHCERDLPLERAAETVGIELHMLRAALRLAGPTARRRERPRTQGAQVPDPHG
ncbi:hypothetical protein [Streptomyces monomycini]|uniref:hypothetical protein n=1 Tax=Streptomyces monomycini TaxID=371720 RepID=UPI0004AB52B4|nr:hypothetical protein [Streptomyces monomycini]